MKEILVGRNAMIKTPFAETNLSLMATIIPFASFVQGTVGSAKKTIINTPIGSDLLASAANSLRLTKVIGGVSSTNANDVFRFFKAAPSGRIEFDFSIEKQRIFTVDWTAYPDSTQSFHLGVFGDATA